jgi:phosphoglycolate phosphatase-like HAD superfamily hydrolase
VRERSVIFWDFDGVIKESVAAKADAFERLFLPFGRELAARVRQHHECNGGLSRFEKIPLYLGWTGRRPSAHEVSRYCALFSTAVRQAVVESAWVPGAREYLEGNHACQRFVLVTATPQAEIVDILLALQVAHWFREVHGAPIAKSDAIASVLTRWDCRSADALVIGDSESDHAAAVAAGVDFLLRRTVFNQALQLGYSGPQCEDFVNG